MENEENKFRGMVILCEHCSTPTNSKYCPFCKTTELRKKQDEENNKIWFEAFNKPYLCPKCQ